MAAALHPSVLVPGYCLDRYELLCPLAEGGMASVWIARLTGKHGFEKLVAIKTILPEFASDDRFRKMFLDEARIASRIEHVHVAQILDLGEQHEILYLVMEYVDGDSLSRLFRTLTRTNQRLPQNILLRIVAEVCGGLHVAHELCSPDGRLLNVVHRDVSPQNILISVAGVTKLIDFGIAKARDRLGEDTNAGLMKGKIHYMAPEQAIGADVDRRTDVFAVGAILYHLLSGKPPFEGEGQRAILHRLGSKVPPKPLPANIPAPVAALVMRALAFEPSDRFANALELQTAIESAMTRSQLNCSTAELASFVKRHMVERTTKRKEAIELAIAAAAERQRVRELLRPPAGEASSISPVSASDGALGLGQDNLRALQALTAGSSPGMSPGPIETAIPIEVEAPPRRSRKLAMLVGAGAIAATAVGVTLFVQNKTQHEHVQATPRPATTTAPSASQAAASASGTSQRMGTIATVNVDELPKVPNALVVNPAPRPTTAASTAATVAPVHTTTTTRKRRVNDGF